MTPTIPSALWALPLLAAPIAVSLAARATEKDPYPNVRESMIAISRQLGVTCAHCHDVNNFKSPAMATFKVAKAHIKIVEMLNSAQGFAGKPKADCYMCHRGEAKYPYAEAKGAHAASGGEAAEKRGL